MGRGKGKMRRGKGKGEEEMDQREEQREGGKEKKNAKKWLNNTWWGDLEVDLFRVPKRSTIQLKPQTKLARGHPPQ